MFRCHGTLIKCAAVILYLFLYFFLPSFVRPQQISSFSTPLLPPHLADKTTLDQFGTKLVDNTKTDCFGEGQEKSIQS